MNYKPTFRIFKIVKGKKEIVHRFESDNYETAYQYFTNYYNQNLSNDTENKYYFEIVHDYFGLDGKKYDDEHKYEYTYDKELREHDISKIDYFKKEVVIPNLLQKLSSDSAGIVHDIINKTKEMQDMYFYIVRLLKSTDLKTAPEKQMDEITDSISKFYDLEHDVKNYINMIKEKHQISEYWSLYNHILDDLKYNIPLLIKNSHGYPGCYDELAKGTGKKPWTLWKEDLKELLLNINLYLYYEGYGIPDKDDKQMKAIHKKYKNTIPIHPGTKRDIDYVKLNELTEKHWDYIWDWMKEKGQGLWD